MRVHFCYALDCDSFPIFGHNDLDIFHYTYTQKGSRLKVPAPSDPGTYEVRYILGHGSNVLDKETITVK